MFKQKPIRFLLVITMLCNIIMPCLLQEKSVYAYDADFSINSSKVVISSNGDYRIYGTTRTQNAITVREGLDNVSITLDGVNIQMLSATGAAPITIMGNSNVRINLVGDNILVGNTGTAGIEVTNSNNKVGTVTITGSGSLMLNGGDYCAGIGGDKNNNAGNVIINGGELNIVGGQKAAGIGGGYNTSGGYVEINGGIINVTAQEGGAAIGGGYNGDCSDVTINGGTVNAIATDGGAGIGGGYRGTTGAITINGGTVTSTNGEFGYSIGCGRYGAGGTVNIAKAADVSAFTGYELGAINFDTLTTDANTLAGYFNDNNFTSNEIFTFTSGDYSKTATFPSGRKAFFVTLEKAGDYTATYSLGNFTHTDTGSNKDIFVVSTELKLYKMASVCSCTLTEPTFLPDSIILTGTQKTKSATLAAKGSVFTVSADCVLHKSKPSIKYIYTIKEDKAQIATISSNKLTVNVPQAGTYQITVIATATAGGLEASTEAIITVIKQTATIDISDEDFRITQNGIYTVKGTTKRNAITIDGGLEDVTLVLTNTTIDLSNNVGPNGVPISIGSGSHVLITTVGNCTLKSNYKGNPINILGGNSLSKTVVTFNGTGTLNLSNLNDNDGVCIGSGGGTELYFLEGTIVAESKNNAVVIATNTFVSDQMVFKFKVQTPTIKPIITEFITKDYEGYKPGYVFQTNIKKSVSKNKISILVKNVDTKKYVLLSDFEEKNLGFAVVLPSDGYYQASFNDTSDLTRYFTYTNTDSNQSGIREFYISPTSYDTYIPFEYALCKCKLSAPTFKIENVTFPYDSGSKLITLYAYNSKLTIDDNCIYHNTSTGIDYKYEIIEDEEEIGEINEARLRVNPTEPGKYKIKIRATASVTGISASKEASFTVTKLTQEATNEQKGQEHRAYINGYKDGTFRPDNSITRAEIATLLVSALDYKGSINFNSTFADVDTNSWYFEDVSRMEYENVLGGYEDKTFKPNNTMTRAEFATTVCRIVNLKISTSKSKFSDVKEHWASDYITTLVSKKYVSGYEDGTFRPDDPVTRAEAVTIINKALGRSANSTKIDEAGADNPYIDITKKHWAYYEIIEASTRHYMKEWH